jgi:tRNA G18 (ribose-2'-O)-methylase SpoU
MHAPFSVCSADNMPIERIQDPADARVDAFRAVRDGELLRTRGQFVAEGRIIVRRVVEDARCRVQSVLVNGAALADLADVLETLTAPVYVASGEVLNAIGGYDVHRGCLAMVERPPATSVDALLAAASSLVVLEGVTNADNVGGLFRNVAAFGFGGVLLSPTCCDPLYRKAIRTSMAAALRVPFARAEEWPAVLLGVRAAGFALVALTPREPSVSLDAFAAVRDASLKIALIAGTEGAGLTPAVEAAADHRVRIAIGGQVDSLNVAVAAGIAMHALRS